MRSGSWPLLPIEEGTEFMNDRMTVLAVDDVELNLLMMRDMLSPLGDSEYLEARNGREALQVLHRNPDIDIVLLDLEMPEMDGIKVLDIMKQSEGLRDIPVIVITADQGEVHKTLAMGANDFMAKPYDPEEFRLRVMNHVRGKKLAELARDMNDILEQEVVRKTSALRKALELSRKAEFEISIRLGRAAEFRDLETGMHIRRISEFSHALARLAGLDDHECEILRHAAPLHDVGKIGIPDSILLKAGKLEPPEFELMKTHTIIGGKILSDGDEFPVIRAGRIVALQHHEKWNGSGYPHGLSGERIHVYGRVVMIADVFDALTSTRPYKEPFTVEQSVEIMRQERGVSFDPELLDLFVVHLPEFIGILEQYRDGSGLHVGP